jgi:hypothetical protein
MNSGPTEWRYAKESHIHRQNPDGTTKPQTPLSSAVNAGSTPLLISQSMQTSNSLREGHDSNSDGDDEAATTHRTMSPSKTSPDYQATHDGSTSNARTSCETNPIRPLLDFALYKIDSLHAKPLQ